MKGAAMLALAALGTTALAQAPAGGPPAGGPPRGGGGGLVQMLVESKAFPDGGIVPAKHSMRGGNVQPDFTISTVPASAQTIAIVMHDISVSLNKGTDDVTHWLAWNIPATSPVTQIEEGKLPAGSVQGANMMRQNAYMGMGAPAGTRYHHYVFEFYALDAKLDLPATATRAELLAALNGKVVAKSSYVGRFKSDAAAAGGPPGAGPGGPPRGPGAPGAAAPGGY
jgi:Raf kinase inhibitor-like YbhB/YbcL family protein